MIGKLTALTLTENQSFAYLRRYALKTIKIAYFNEHALVFWIS